jgi:dTDP-4-dehydrorhamnose reductase
MATKNSLTEKILKNSRYFILRTSWVYGDGDNFIKIILRLASEQNHLKVIHVNNSYTCSNF